MTRSHFEWDDAKDRANQAKHDVPFHLAQLAFDPHRVIVQGIEYSQDEDRFYCFGMVNGGVLTVPVHVPGRNNLHL